MKTIEIKRVESKLGVLRGVLLVDGVFECCTLERAYLNNQKDISAIPTGEYEVVHYSSEHFKDCFKVLNVPDRTDILIHVGNTQKDSKGCILLGQSFGYLEAEPAVTSSRAALSSVKEKMKNEEKIKLIIT